MTIAESADVWMVTGASRGLGREIAAAALTRGKRVVGTFRDAGAAAEFTSRLPEHALGVVVDVRSHESTQDAVASALERFGRIDILANNAGAGQVGAIEEVEPEAFRDLIDVNVIGAMAVTQAVLPSMRRHRRGLIYQMSSVSGLCAMAGLGHYAATKFALEGFSEALALEVAPLGIRVVIVEPGPFRTDWIAGAAAAPHHKIDDYGDTHVRMGNLSRLDGNQEGDPRKAAHLLVELSGDHGLPLRLPLGATAFTRIRGKLQAMMADLDRVERVASDTEFD